MTQGCCSGHHPNCSAPICLAVIHRTLRAASPKSLLTSHHAPQGASGQGGLVLTSKAEGTPSCRARSGAQPFRSQPTAPIRATKGMLRAPPVISKAALMASVAITHGSKQTINMKPCIYPSLKSFRLNVNDYHNTGLSNAKQSSHHTIKKQNFKK